MVRHKVRHSPSVSQNLGLEVLTLNAKPFADTQLKPILAQQKAKKAKSRQQRLSLVARLSIRHLLAGVLSLIAGIAAVPLGLYLYIALQLQDPAISLTTPAMQHLGFLVSFQAGLLLFAAIASALFGALLRLLAWAGVFTGFWIGFAPETIPLRFSVQFPTEFLTLLESALGYWTIEATIPFLVLTTLCALLFAGWGMAITPKFSQWRAGFRTTRVT